MPMPQQMIPQQGSPQQMPPPAIPQRPPTPAPTPANPQQAQAVPQKKPVQADPQIIELQQRLLVAAMKKVYEEKATKAIVKGLSQYKTSPEEALANMAMTIIYYVQGAMKNVPPNAVLLIALPVLYIVGELADAAGLFQVDQATIDRAFEAMRKMVAPPTQPKPTAPEEQTPQGLIGSAQPAGA